jgi:hypothetical protein
MAAQLLSFKMDIAGVRRSFQAIGAGLADTRKPLRVFGRYLSKKYLEKISSGGGGSWAPLAEGTKHNLLKGNLKADGTVRLPVRKRLEKLEGHLKKQLRQARFEDAASRRHHAGAARGSKVKRLQGQLERLQADLTRLRDQRARAQAPTVPERLVDLAVVSERGRARVRVTTPGYDRTKNVSFPRHLREEGRTFQVPASAISTHRAGHYVVKPSALGVERAHKKTALSRHKFYGKLGWFNVKVEANTLTIAMPPVDWLWRLHDGDGPIPARPVMPDTLDQEDADKLVEVAQEHAIHIWETTP